ncbi:MAG: STT3 domain-containing protein [Candidatus Micrarchaeota archaeon]
MLGLLAVIVICLLTGLAGIPLAFALLKGTGLGRFEKAVVGVVLGMTLPATLGFLEFLTVGIKFSAALAVVNYLIFAAAGFALLWKQRQFPELRHFASRAAAQHDWLKLARANWAPIILFVVIIAGFWVRAGSWSTNFFEFDPYYYTYTTQYLVTGGEVPAKSFDTYYPSFLSHRYHPLVSYMAGGWYLVYQAVALPSYSKDVLILAQQLYPALLGALLAFFAFLFVRERYGSPAGLVAGLFIAFSPQLIKKFAAGVAELQPMGVFMALVVFAFVAIALQRKSMRLNLFAGLLSFLLVLSGQQYVWPVIVLAAYIALQALFDFLNDSLDLHEMALFGSVTVGTLAGVLAYTWYRGESFPFAAASILLAGVVAAFLYGVKSAKLPLEGKTKKAAGVALLLVVGLGVLFGTSFGQSVLSVINSFAGFGGTVNPLGNTVAEENPANEAFFAASYGVLPPYFLLGGFTVLVCATAVLSLFVNGRKKLAALVAALTVIVVFFNSLLDGAIKAVFGGVTEGAYANLIKFITTSDVFLYLAVVVVALFVTQLFDSKDKRLLLLYGLVILPVAYIGLQKMKYNLHLGFVLALAIAIVLGELALILRELNERFKFASASSIKWTAVGIILLVGGGMVVFQIVGNPPSIPGLCDPSIMSSIKFPGVCSSMIELNYSHISGDWLLAMSWLSNNTSNKNPSTVSACEQKFGWQCNVMSWWDYGHWTMFLGDTNSVLNPLNSYPNYDQEVAHGFVDGKTQDFIASMKAHHATHVLVDAQLIQKWGALVYLSGTCTPEMSSLCPPAYIENWREGAGKSRYEAEHYFEYLTLDGQCPTAVPMPALKSSFGMVYCAGQNELMLLGRGGELVADYRRPYVVVQDLATTQEINENTSYLFPYAQNTFVNPNPDLSPAGYNNTLIKSVFVRLYLFENLPGFRLAYRSPHGEVKIFEIDPALLK